MNLNEIFDHGRDAAKMLFEKRGSISPMWIAESKGGEIVPIVVPMPDDSKDDVAKALKQLFRAKDIVRYVSILEAWMLEPKTKGLPESIKLGGRISQHPDRREVIWIMAEDENESKAGMFYILRPEHGKPRLSPFKVMEHDRQEGRFCELLK